MQNPSVLVPTKTLMHTDLLEPQKAKKNQKFILKRWNFPPKLGLVF